MKKVVAVILLLSILPVLKGQMQQAVDRIQSEYHLMGLSVTTICKDRVTGSYNSGMRDMSHHLPVNDSTMYRIASISKLVTTTALMKLYDEGLFRLDDDVSKYLGFPLRNPNFPDEPVTFRMLLSHTSSLNDGTGYDSFLTDTYNNVGNPPEFSQLVIPGGSYYTDDMWMKEKPGTYFIYCNANFGLTGTLIEKISGKSFDVFVRENIFRPLGITGAFTVEGLSSVRNLSVLYRTENDVWVPQADDFNGALTSPRNFNGYKPGTNAAVFSPQGGLRISPLELSRIMMLHINRGRYHGEQIISARSIRLMHKPQWKYNGSNGENNGGLLMCWGLGVQIITNTPSGDMIFKDLPLKGHSGSAYGLISGFYFDPRSRSGFIFMTNGVYGELKKGTYSSYFDFEEAIFSAVWKNSYPPCLED